MDERARSAGIRSERTQASPQFHGGLFRNPRHTVLGPRPGTRLEVAREFLFGGQARRPPRPLPTTNPLPGWARRVETGLRATWLGHSTVLLELDGHRVLTDPVWSERISPFPLAAPRRFQPVPVGAAALPPLDAIVISHDHFDHLDEPTIRMLAPLGVPFVVPLGVGMYLEGWGVPAAQIVELDWWEATHVRGLRLTATPAQHFSGRVGKRNHTLWASFVIEGERHRVFFSGDTALTPEFVTVRERLGPFDLVMLEIGGFDPKWDHIHLGPANALEALRLLGGGRFLPVHWGTFNLALHAWDFPPETLIELGASPAEPTRGVELLLPRIGAAIEPSRGLTVEPWWRSVTARERETRRDAFAR
jgi:L-ascorbate metabolism protein UlaG (beta-lactamase superfamily)